MNPPIDNAVQNGKLLLRGSPEWDRREYQRFMVGCSLLSFGTVYDSNKTNGTSAMQIPARVMSNGHKY